MLYGAGTEFNTLFINKSTAVFSTVASQQEYPGFDSRVRRDLSEWLSNSESSQ